jgi:hypothetical protein
MVPAGGGPPVAVLDFDAATLVAGGWGLDGLLALRSAEGAARIRLDAALGRVLAGGGGADGDLVLLGADGESRVHVDGGRAAVRLRDSRGRETIALHGDRGVITLRDPASGKETITLDARAGDIRLAMADFAEEFPAREPIESGTVVVLDEDGGVAACTREADPRVCGVVAGAGGFRPAIVGDHRGTPGRVAVSLLGKAGCKVDASERAVAPGDLLVTSRTPGHARHGAQEACGPGTVVGKALAGLTLGSRGVIPVLLAQR